MKGMSIVMFYFVLGNSGIVEIVIICSEVIVCLTTFHLGWTLIKCGCVWFCWVGWGRKIAVRLCHGRNNSELK